MPFRVKKILTTGFLLFSLLPIAAQRRVAVLLPFSSGGAMGESMVEFYRGFLMAVDSARVLGQNLEIHALDAGETPEQLESVLRSGEIKKMDYIIGPALPNQTDVLADYCRRHDIKLVVPFNTPYATLPSNPSVYQAVASYEIQVQGALQLVVENFADAHFVFLKTNNYNERGIAFQSALRQQLERFGVSLSDLSITADDLELDRAMSITRRNVILLDSPTEQSLQHAVGLLKRFQEANPSYQLSLLGYPEWLDKADAYSNIFHGLDTYIFTTFYNNPLSGRTIRFRRQYEDAFQAEMPRQFPSLCMMGFDLGLTLFLENKTPLQNGYRFTPVDDDHGGYVNSFVELVHYTPNRLIKLLR